MDTNNLPIAYIFQQQQLLVDANFNLPCLEQQEYDLPIQADPLVIARDFQESELIPNGYQFIPIRQLLQYWTKPQFEQASRAFQLLEWRRNHQFCSRCGHKTQQHKTEYSMTCPACNFSQYPRVNPCVITIITRGGRDFAG